MMLKLENVYEEFGRYMNAVVVFLQFDRLFNKAQDEIGPSMEREFVFLLLI